MDDLFQRPLGPISIILNFSKKFLVKAEITQLSSKKNLRSFDENWRHTGLIRNQRVILTPPPQCPKWRNIAKKLRFFSKPNWVARINIWIMPIQNLALLSYFGTSKLPILVPKVGCLRQNFRFDFTVVILLSKFLEKPNKVRA